MGRCGNPPNGGPKLLKAKLNRVRYRIRVRLRTIIVYVTV